MTITAEVQGIPEGIDYGVQWQNDLSGEFEDVQGATDVNITFVATEEKMHCKWRVRLTAPEE